ncbi:MAG: hypothetical protein ACLU4N_18465 [Butyricimonas faecihominis]
MKDVNEVYSKRIEAWNGYLEAKNAEDAWILFRKKKTGILF